MVYQAEAFLYIVSHLISITTKINPPLLYATPPCDLYPSCHCVYEEHHLIVKCYEKIFPKFPRNKNITSIKLILTRVELFKDKSFLGLEHLQELDLSGNKIRYLEPDAFFNLGRLKSLNLASNNLSYNIASFQAS